MLQFNETNIYTFDKGINQRYVALYGGDESLLPFQFHSSLIGTVSAVYLRDGIREHNITSKITINKFRTALTSAGAWYVFKKGGYSGTSYCGKFQYKVVITNGIDTKTYYSNWFSLVDEIKMTNYLVINNNYDFDGKIYGANYSDYLYFFEFQIKEIEPFYFEESEDNGNGLISITYQNYLKQFEIKIRVDDHQIKELNKLRLFNNCSLFLNGQNYLLFENPIFQQSYNDLTKLYDVNIVLKISNIEKGTCNTDAGVYEYTGLNERTEINNSGDKGLINATDFELIN
jgi:hypothetical protein